MQFIQYECINLFLKYLLFKKRKYFDINLKMCAGAICLKIKKKLIKKIKRHLKIEINGEIYYDHGLKN